jgi:drug/metabolite transporter (DMT)-like permease
MGLKDTLLCSVFAIALPIGQLIFKWAAIYNARLDGALPWRLMRNWPLLGAFAWYGVTALFWFYILTRVPLSNAYGFSILGSALVPLMAWAIFREPLNWQMAGGFALMFLGLLLVSRAQA